MPEQKYAGWTIPSFVLGLIGILLLLISSFLVPYLLTSLLIPISYLEIFSLILVPSSLILPILSIIFGIIALVKINKDKTLKGKALAIIGIILAVVCCIFFLIGIFSIFYLFGGFR